MICCGDTGWLMPNPWCRGEGTFWTLFGSWKVCCPMASENMPPEAQGCVWIWSRERLCMMPWGRSGFGGAFSSRSGLTMAMKRSKMTVIVACHFVEFSPYPFLVVCCPAMLICQTYCTYMHHFKASVRMCFMIHESCRARWS